MNCPVPVPVMAGGGCTPYSTLPFYIFLIFFWATPQQPEAQQQIHHQLWQPNGWAMTTNGCSACCLCTTNKRCWRCLNVVVVAVPVVVVVVVSVAAAASAAAAVTKLYKSSE